MSFNRISGRAREFVAAVNADEIVKEFDRDFMLKQKSKRQAKSMYPDEDFGPDIIIISPTIENRTDRLLPPQAYPNFMEESLVIASVQKKSPRKDPLLLFLLYHEIEHCTIPAYNLEAETQKLFIIVITTALLTLLFLEINIFGWAFVTLYFLILIFEARILIPAQIETRTDLRAFGRLNSESCEVVAKIREAEYRKKIASYRKSGFIRYFQPTYLKIYLQYRMLQTVVFGFDGPSYWPAAVNAFAKNTDWREQHVKSVSGLGNRSLFGAILAYPLTISLYFCDIRATDAIWMSAPLYLGAAVLIYTGGIFIAVKAAEIRGKRKVVLDQILRK